MRGEIRTAPVERQFAPSLAERGESAIAILEMQEPAKSRKDRRGGTFTQVMQRDERGRRVVCIGNTAGMRGPRPSSRFRAGEGMENLGLMRDQKRAETVFLLIVQIGRECADGKGRDPLAQVAVNRPRAVFPLDLDCTLDTYKSLTIYV